MCKYNDRNGYFLFLFLFFVNIPKQARFVIPK